MSNPTCPMHNEEAVWRDKRGYWHCPKCLDIIHDNYMEIYKALQEVGMTARTILKKLKER